MQTSYPREKVRVLLLEGVHPSAVRMFRDHGYSQVESVTGALSESELCKMVKDVHLLGIRSKTQLTKKVLESADRLLAVGAFCIGTNQIDLPTAT